MQIFYFTLGVLTVIALTLVVVVIIGMFKISKLKREIKDFETSYRWNEEFNYRRIESQTRDFEEKFSNFERNLERASQDCISYTDKRIDKVIYQYKENQN